MKAVQVHDAVGMVLSHDLTQVIPGKFKGPAFRKGHILRHEDIPRLLDMGKRHVYVFDLSEGLLHENDAAKRLALAGAGPGVELTDPKEGKVSLLASRPGLLKINRDLLDRVNEADQVMYATLHNNQVVAKGKPVAGTRVIPLVIEEEKISSIEQICLAGFPLVEVKPLRPLKAGLIVTGSEVYSGRIKDAFGPVVRQKIEDYGGQILRQVYASDDIEMISASIRELTAEGAELILVTGGMSVDPDDVTPAAIREAGGQIVTYGAPTLPGAMFLLAYLNSIPVLGLPGCVMYHRSTIFDLMLPRIMAGETITRKDITRLGHGGLCANCPECRFPDCGFGKV